MHYSLISFLLQATDVMQPTEEEVVAGVTALVGVFGFFWVFFCSILLLSYGLLFLISYLVYRDAVNNNVDNPLLWAIITFLTGIIGIVLYIVIGRNQKNVNNQQY